MPFVSKLIFGSVAGPCRCLFITQSGTRSEKLIEQICTETMIFGLFQRLVKTSALFTELRNLRTYPINKY